MGVLHNIVFKFSIYINVCLEFRSFRFVRENRFSQFDIYFPSFFHSFFRFFIFAVLFVLVFIVWFSKSVKLVSKQFVYFHISIHLLHTCGTYKRVLDVNGFFRFLIYLVLFLFFCCVKVWTWPWRKMHEINGKRNISQRFFFLSYETLYSFSICCLLSFFILTLGSFSTFYTHTHTHVQKSYLFPLP